MALRSVVGSGITKLNYYLMNPIYKSKTHNTILAGNMGFCHNNNKYSYYCTAASTSASSAVIADAGDDDVKVFVGPVYPEVLARIKEMRFGIIHDIPEEEFQKYWIMENAHFAVNKHNEDQNDHLEFVRVVEAKRQRVSGYNFFITLEAKDGLVGKLNKYHAKVWVRPRRQALQLAEWKPVDDNSLMDAA